MLNYFNYAQLIIIGFKCLLFFCGGQMKAERQHAYSLPDVLQRC